jgi:3-phenylpropionate/cinnamic acid dioxygenase small subunit
MSNSVHELTGMVHHYCELFDTGDFDAFARQFEHGAWYRAAPGAEGVLAFLDEHVLLYDGLPCTKHVTTNLVIDVDEDDQTATASSYVTVFQALPDFPLQPIFMGRYKDRFERVDGVWRWLERQVIGDLRGDTSRHTRPPRTEGT